MKNTDKAIEITERIGEKAAELDEIIEGIHYNPENAKTEDIETLKEIEKLIKQATKMAKQAR